jgi:predicted AlkP superfamily phosphohydrolase/phosphomutase
LRKVIVVGLDGLEPSIVGPMLDAGELPNLARMRARGGFSRVATTTPAQTPVAWSTFATGVNPGGHGIFDFIRRDPATYRPDLALNRYERKNAFTGPRAVNLRRGTPVWELLSDAGIPSTILRCPCTYPPEPVRGRMLSGMGVPDLRGGLGTPTFYSTAEGLAPGESEHVVPLRREPDGSFRTHLLGPRNPSDGSDLRGELTIHPDLDAGRVVIRSGGTPAELEVREGSWSGWLRMKFKAGLLHSARGMVRFRLVRLGPGTELELYASPVNFDPASPLFPISSPPDYARQLAEDVEAYYTAGMIEDHTGLNNGRIGLDAFLDQCDDVWDEREAMMALELGRFDEGLFYCLFDTPDRVQHMLWAHRESDHPAHRGRGPDPAYARTIEEHYRRGDQVVGRALESADDETLVVVLSDHGFNSFRRGVHLNTWLHDQGFLRLRPGVGPGEDCQDMLRDVDWGQTRAYALGLGGIYLNLKGREGQGTVEPAEAESLKSAIAGGLAGLRDPATGEVAVRSVKSREELYRGPCTAEAPDLFANFAAGYRSSWGSSMGGVPEGHFEDNTRPWGGDHIIDPQLVPGVLFMDRPFRGDAARLEDLAPTILAALGAPRGPVMEGMSLLS